MKVQDDIEGELRERIATLERELAEARAIIEADPWDTTLNNAVQARVAAEREAEGLWAALEKIAGSHWERTGHCQSDVDDVPDLSAEEAMQCARAALHPTPTREGGG